MIRYQLTPGRFAGTARISAADLSRAARVISRALKIRKSVTLSVAMVDTRTMQRWNERYRGKSSPTDVLSFTYGEGEVFGEILLCPSVARKQAKEARRSLRKELLELLVHGTLHVFGYDHEKPKDAKMMLPLQDKIMASL